MQIELLDKDDFLGRARGTREKSTETRSRRPSSALMHYLPTLNKAVFCAFHMNFSEDAELPIFAFKVLSRFMGYTPLQINANKVLLLERAAALRIFGYAVGFNASRAGYFLCYSSYAAAAEVSDINLLGGYRRRKFLRYRGDMPSSPKRIKY